LTLTGRASGLVGGLAARPWWVDALAIGLVSRIYSLAVIGLAAQRAEQLGPGIWTGRDGALAAWDGIWYLRIAASGYHAAPIEGLQDFAFLPLWPILIKVMSLASLVRPDIAGAILANGFFLAASVLVFRLFIGIRDRATARVGLAMLAFGPGAYVFSMVYAESLFLLLAAASFCTWGWRRAGFVALAGLTRLTGLALAVGGLLEALRPGRRREGSMVFTAGVLVFLAWWVFIWILTGEPLGFMRGTPAWKQDISDLGSVLDGPYGLGLAVAAYALAMLLGGIRLVRDGHVAPGTYAVIAAAMALLFGAWSELPRYTLAAFPACVALVGFLPTTRTKILVVVVLAALQLAFAFATFAGLGPP
jgi:hypothetical protein